MIFQKHVNRNKIEGMYYESPLPIDNPYMLLDKAMIHIAEWVDTHGWDSQTVGKIQAWKPELYDRWGRYQDDIDKHFKRTFPNPETVFENEKWPNFFNQFILPYADICVDIIRAADKIS